MSLSLARKRVAAGVQWLNEHEPGWHNKINLGSLNIASCRDCVGAQVIGDEYWVFTSKFELDYDRTVALGFHRGVTVTYGELNRAWTEAILDIRGCDIGQPLREVTFEPLPEEVPAEEPVVAPEREPVPA